MVGAAVVVVVVVVVVGAAVVVGTAREGVPSDKKDADKQLKQIKGILDQMYENQPLLDETKVAIKDILRKNANAPGAEKLDGILGDAVKFLLGFLTIIFDRNSFLIEQYG